jgi:ferredoxin
MAEGDRIELDYEYCYQSGECVLMAPDVYRFGDEGFPELVEGGVANASTSLLAGTVENCPSGAITFIPAESG